MRFFALPLFFFMTAPLLQAAEPQSSLRDIMRALKERGPYPVYMKGLRKNDPITLSSPLTDSVEFVQILDSLVTNKIDPTYDGIAIDLRPEKSEREIILSGGRDFTYCTIRGSDNVNRNSFSVIYDNQFTNDLISADIVAKNGDKTKIILEKSNNLERSVAGSFDKTIDADADGTYVRMLFAYSYKGVHFTKSKLSEVIASIGESGLYRTKTLQGEISIRGSANANEDLTGRNFIASFDFTGKSESDKPLHEFLHIYLVSSQGEMLLSSFETKGAEVRPRGLLNVPEREGVRDASVLIFLGTEKTEQFFLDVPVKKVRRTSP